MFFKLEITGENEAEILRITRALQGLNGEVTKTEAQPDKAVEAPKQETAKKITAKKSETKTQEAPKEEVKADEPKQADTAESMAQAEKPAEETTDVKVDVAMCRALATKAIQSNKANDVNQIVTEVGKATSLSKIPAELLPAVYEKLKELVGA